MSNGSFASRMISTDRNIRQRCQLKYSKHGLLSWDKWIEYDCIFSSYLDPHGIQHNQLELHSKNNIQDPSGKVIGLRKLHSVTSLHGNTDKNEPKDIIILQIDGRKHRFGFDNIYEYNQLKTLLDGVFNSGRDLMRKDRYDESATVNMLYDSVTALRYSVNFADLETQEVLALPSGMCELVVDSDKIILEQRNEKQYTFPRSTIRTIRLVDDNIIGFELGSRAPVQGFINFRFDSAIDARACFLIWNEGVTTTDIIDREPGVWPSRRDNVQESRVPPPRVPLKGQYSSQSQSSRPPRALSSKSSYYNTEPPTLSTANECSSEYKSFHTLV